ncbi:hypothetical protein [Stenotrophomonas sp. PS02289]|uniref:hypothetical protein n=1 Tax=Stenotrophomonas sp. PS02289 TaxID=2991422 RepID=UPI00249C66EE|nr:hypothetical protein [Stenotrophomonas sp. PS02289]
MGVLTACVALAAQTAHATTTVVTNPTAMVQQLIQYVLDAQAYSKEAQRWKQTEQQIKDMRAIFDSVNFQLSLPDGMSMDGVADDYMVKQVCGDSSSASLLQRGFSALNLSSTSAVKEEQVKICVSIQMAQNRKYNESLEFLKSTMKQIQEAEQQNLESRDSDKNSSGSVQATQSDTARLSNHLLAMGQEWSTRIQAYDAYIAAMQARQNVIAQAAITGNGASRVVTDVAKTVVLKKALDDWANK